MGGGLVLLFRNSGEDVGAPVRNKDWWGGLLSDVRVWTPNQVGVTKEIWVSIFGVPPHAWGEATFAKLVNSCGVLLEVDAETRNKSRFDVARVKIVAPLCGRIDFSVNLRVQGAKFAVRMVEEGGGLIRDDGYVEDQLRESEIGSSCATGGNGSVRAVMEGFDGVVSESEGSDYCEQNIPRDEEEGNRSKGYNQGVEDKGDVSERVVGGLLDTPRKAGNVLVTDDNSCMGGQKEVRGSGRRVDKRYHVVDEATLENSPLEIQSTPLNNGVGLGQLNSGVGPQPFSGAVVHNGAIDDEQCVGLGLDPNLDPNLLQTKVSSGAVPTKKLMIDNLDHMISMTRGRQQPERLSSLSEEIPTTGGDTQLSQGRQRKLLKGQTPFPHMFGPRCLRFAGVINNSVPIRKQRKTVDTEQGVSGSQIQDIAAEDGVVVEQGEVLGLVVGDGSMQAEVEQHQNSNGLEVEHHHNTQGLDLSVCLPFHVGIASSSGVKHLLGEDSIKDVDGFITARDNPESIAQEARQLLTKQQELGINFVQRQDLPIDRMVTMEVRDREKLPIEQESNGFQ
jgi:hypothetical protein